MEKGKDETTRRMVDISNISMDSDLTNRCEYIFNGGCAGYHDPYTGEFDCEYGTTLTCEDCRYGHGIEDPEDEHNQP